MRHCTGQSGMRLVFVQFTLALAWLPAILAVAAGGGVVEGAPGIPQDSGAAAAQPGRLSPSVRHTARGHIRYAIDLAERGAVCSARAELMEALSSVAFALDGEQSQTVHRDALAAGLRAIREAEDFAPQGLRADVQLNLARVIASHRTPLLKDVDVSRLTPVEALQRYYGYATEELIVASGHEEAASMALYGWGRLEVSSPPVGINGNALAVPRAIALERAAFQVDSGNYLAANELAVLLARCEQWSEAKELLLHSLSVKPTAETWHNLSAVYANLGQTSDAQQAHQQYLALAGNVQASAQGAVAGKTPMMRWVDPAVFVRESGPDQLGSLATDPELPAMIASRGNSPGPSKESPSTSKNPLSQVSSWLNRKLGGEQTSASDPTPRNRSGRDPKGSNP